MNPYIMTQQVVGENNVEKSLFKCHYRNHSHIDSKNNYRGLNHKLNNGHNEHKKNIETPHNNMWYSRFVCLVYERQK